MLPARFTRLRLRQRRPGLGPNIKHSLVVDPFSYLSVLISIVLALGMTRVLQGVGEMLQARRRRHIYWVQIVWATNLFIYLVIAWWIFYRWRNQQPWNFYLFIFVLISPTILYLASLLLFPSESDLDKPVDYKAHYYANHRAFFIIFSLWTPVDIVDSLLKGWAHFLELGITYDVSGTLFFAGLVTAAITRNETYHKIYSVCFLLQTVWISWTLFRTLV